jgi:uncharacterized membrane protein YfcA
VDVLGTALLAGAGVAAGVVNAIAGGGSLISFPALLAFGYPTVAANVTNTVALWPGYIGGAAGYRSELTDQRGRLVEFSVTSVVGAAVGCVLLLITPEGVFDALVPILIAVSSLLLAVQPWLKNKITGSDRLSGRRHQILLHAGIFLGGVYGAYFGAGLGVMLLGILGVFIHDHLQRVNAIRAVLALVINTVAFAAFALFGPVRWYAVAVMAVASLAGGFFGARVARRLSPAVLRGVIVTFGFGVGVALALH